MLVSRRSDWTAPLRLTAWATGAREADFHAGRSRLVFVSTEGGSEQLWLQDDAPLAVAPPRAMFPHSARDRHPRFSPDGRRVVFVSGRQDAGGDIWLITLARGLRPHRLAKLTGPEGADDQPCWHPDGRKVFFASAPSLSGHYDLWELDLPTGRRTQLTDSGGQMPDCSPDGRWLAFASRGQGPGVSLYVMRLSDRSVAPLTASAAIDALPCWSEDGRWVYFTRYGIDTNADGRVDRGDSSSLFRVGFDERLFTDGALPPARQLTSFAASEWGPRCAAGGIIFSSDRASGARGSVDVWALPACGEAPDLASVGEFVAFARAQDADPRADLHERLLAWQNVLWAAREARYSGRIAPGSVAAGGVGQAWLRVADLLMRLGYGPQAEAALRQVPGEPDADEHLAAEAEVRLLELERLKLETLPAGTAAALWEPHLARCRDLLRRTAELASDARDGGRAEVALRMGRVCALAQLETGLALYALKRYEEALEAFGAVADRYPEHEVEAARAMMAQADVFRLLQQPETVRGAYLRLLEKYPDCEPYASRAAGLVVDGILAETAPAETFERKLADLRGLIEEHGGDGLLPALAQNRIADLYHAARDYQRAREALRSTIRDYPDQHRQVAVAYLALAAIETDQENYLQALEAYGQVQSRPELGTGVAGAPSVFERARRGYVGTVLLKGDRELRAGDPALALSTYSQLIEFDRSLAAGHRGLVDCLARLGRTDEAVVHYREQVERDATDDVAHYGLALAYSYYGPQDWMGGGSAARRRVGIDRQALRLLGRAVLVRYDVPYYHQLRWFLLSRIGVIEDDVEARQQALAAGLVALGLSDPRLDRANHANLLFNVGEAYAALEQGANAYDYYLRALDAGFPLEGVRGEAAMEKIGLSALDAGRYEHATQLCGEALARLDGPLAEDAAARRARLVRRAKLLDELALAHYLREDHAAAAEYYRRTAEAIVTLMEHDPRRKDAYMRNLLRARRNQAVAMCRAVEAGALDEENLATAYDLLLEALKEVERVGVVSRDETAPGLLVIDVEVALGEGRGLAAFDVDAEKRLLYRFLALISARGGDYESASSFLKEKLALYPELPEGTDRTDVLSEEAIVWSQFGQYLLMLGRRIEAAEAYRKAMALEKRARNIRGEMANCFSRGRVVLQMASSTERRDGLSGQRLRNLTLDAIRRHRDVLERSRAESGAQLVDLEASLNANLARLSSVADRLGAEVEEGFGDAQ